MATAYLYSIDPSGNTTVLYDSSHVVIDISGSTIDLSENLIDSICTSADGRYILATLLSFPNLAFPIPICILSSDYGGSWTLITFDEPFFAWGSAMSLDGRIMYVMMYTFAQVPAGIGRSTDHGQTWETILDNGIGSDFIAQTLYCSPDGRFVYFSDTFANIYVSSDYGNTFRATGLVFNGSVDFSVIDSISFLGISDNLITYDKIVPYTIYSSPFEGECVIPFFVN
ncbi:MAG: exo-alpha-sialidase [Betaproteobacteria bacterium]|nr:exo-alpha-sialidase [Betaproteobacteria bacterium]